MVARHLLLLAAAAVVTLLLTSPHLARAMVVDETPLPITDGVSLKPLPIPKGNDRIWQPATPDPDAKAKGLKYAPGIITSAGLDCQLADARFIDPSRDPKTRAITSYFFEIACKDAEGFIVGVPAEDVDGFVAGHPAKSGPPPIIHSCLEAANGADGNTAAWLSRCILPANADPKLGLTALVAKNRPDCQLTDARALGRTQGHDATVFEVACQGGVGYIVDASYPFSAAKPAKFTPCVLFTPDAATHCVLTSQAVQDAYFALLLAQVGRPCTATNHSLLGVGADGADYFEIACQEGNGYMFALGADGEPGHATDCTYAELLGLGCSLTQPSAALSRLTADLKKLGRTSCTVSGERVLGVTRDKARGYVEVACADGGPGFLVGYDMSDMTPKDATACPVAKLMGDGCQLPQNQPAAPSRQEIN